MAGTDNVSEAAAAAAQCKERDRDPLNDRLKERESQAVSRGEMLGDVDSVL